MVLIYEPKPEEEKPKMDTLLLENNAILQRLENGNVKFEQHENSYAGRVLFEHTFKPHEYRQLRQLFADDEPTYASASQEDYVGGPLTPMGRRAGS